MNISGSEVKTVVDRRPEFDDIIDRLILEVNNTKQLAVAISGKTAKLQEFRTPVKGSDGESLGSDGVIGALRSIIANMSVNNDILVEAEQALGRYVG
jgi:hypothetical protein